MVDGELTLALSCFARTNKINNSVLGTCYGYKVANLLYLSYQRRAITFLILCFYKPLTDLHFMYF